ncbi:MAG TPA: AAA family ATPase [Actinomycetota bacterium]|nr:AAA family ATPase [Actinomycetota bacterium]
MGGEPSAPRRPSKDRGGGGSVLLLTGPPGAGKSTVARTVAARFERSVHVEADRFYGFVVGGYIDPWEHGAHDQNVVAVEIACDAAARWAEVGYVTILDGIFIPGWFFEPAIDRLHARSLDVSAAILRPSVATTIARARARVPPKRLPDEVLERLWRGFDDLGPLERHVIDNGEETAERTADRVLAALASPAV